MQWLGCWFLVTRVARLWIRVCGRVLMMRLATDASRLRVGSSCLSCWWRSLGAWVDSQCVLGLPYRGCVFGMKYFVKNKFCKSHQVYRLPLGSAVCPKNAISERHSTSARSVRSKDGRLHATFAVLLRCVLCARHVFIVCVCAFLLRTCGRFSVLVFFSISFGVFVGFFWCFCRFLLVSLSVSSSVVVSFSVWCFCQFLWCFCVVFLSVSSDAFVGFFWCLRGFLLSSGVVVDSGDLFWCRCRFHLRLVSKLFLLCWCLYGFLLMSLWVSFGVGVGFFLCWCQFLLVSLWVSSGVGVGFFRLVLVWVSSGVVISFF